MGTSEQPDPKSSEELLRRAREDQLIRDALTSRTPEQIAEEHELVALATDLARRVIIAQKQSA